MFGVTGHNRSGVQLRVTNHERTLVDVLDRPDLTGSWEEIWRSLESVEFFSLDQVIEYTRLLENATTAAKVGFFLEQHREPFESYAGWFDSIDQTVLLVDTPGPSAGKLSAQRFRFTPVRKRGPGAQPRSG